MGFVFAVAVRKRPAKSGKYVELKKRWLTQIIELWQQGHPSLSIMLFQDTHLDPPKRKCRNRAVGISRCRTPTNVNEQSLIEIVICEAWLRPSLSASSSLHTYLRYQPWCQTCPIFRHLFVGPGYRSAYWFWSIRCRHHPVWRRIPRETESHPCPAPTPTCHFHFFGSGLVLSLRDLKLQTQQRLWLSKIVRTR